MAVSTNIRLQTFYSNIDRYLDDQLCNDDLLRDADYVPGTRPHGSSGPMGSTPSDFGSNYEDTIVDRVSRAADCNVLVLLGGLGSGKSTTSRQVIRRLKVSKSRIGEHEPECGKCLREPKYFDFKHLKRTTAYHSALHSIFGTIRKAFLMNYVREKLVSLKLLGEEAEDTVRVLTSLVFLGGIRRWVARTEHQHFPPIPGLDVPANIPTLEEALKSHSLDELVMQYRALADSLHDALERDLYVNEETAWLERQESLTAAVLGFYSGSCGCRNKGRNCLGSVLVIDNLDQLPTATITAVSKSIYNIGFRTPLAKFLVPLRPTSVGPAGRVANPTFIYHCAPNSFEMMLQRLRNYVFRRTRANLSSQSPDDGLPPLFSANSGSRREELDYFLISSAIYARIMAAGLYDSDDDANSACVLGIEEEYLGLFTTIQMPFRAAKSIASTIGAVVGVVARQATRHLSWFFHTMYYSDSSILLHAREALASAPSPTGGKIRLPYRHLVEAVLLNHQKRLNEKRCMNIFRPSRTGPHSGWPSLTKLRVLTLLAGHKSLLVSEVTQYLALYGIPADVTVESINELRDEDYILVWGERNDEYVLPECLTERVYLSEQGVGYATELCHNFEYVWACAEALDPTTRIGQPTSFRSRLQAYLSIIDRMIQIEERQLAFRRLRETETTPPKWGVGGMRVLMLDLTYKSAEMAAASAIGAVKVAGRPKGYNLQDNRQYAEDVCELLASLLNVVNRCETLVDNCSSRQEIELRDWSHSHNLANHIRNFVDVASPLGISTDKVTNGLAELESRAAHSSTGVIMMPGHDAITVVANLGRRVGLIPNSILAELDKVEAVSVERQVLLGQLAKLRYILESGLPRYWDLTACLESAIVTLDALIRSANASGAATATTLLGWARELHAKFTHDLQSLRAGKFGVTTDTSAYLMSEAKDKCNAQLAVCMDLARNLGCEDPARFRHLTWT